MGPLHREGGPGKKDVYVKVGTHGSCSRGVLGMENHREHSGEGLR